MKYVITGQCGLIGEKLKQRLDNAGHECVLKVDLRVGEDVVRLPYANNYEADIFFHLASKCKINKCIEIPRLSHSHNADGTFEALEYCRKNNIKKFVFFSSSRVLSKERNIYTASKIYGEELCKAYYECYGIEYIIVRPSTVYGEHHDFTTRLLSTWVINALNKDPLTIFGDDEKTLDFTHVDDFLDGLTLLINNWNVTKNNDFNISGNDIQTLLDVAIIISKEIGEEVKIEYEREEIAQPQQVSVDISKIKLLGYKPKIKLEEGIKRMIKFYKGEGRCWLK